MGAIRTRYHYDPTVPHGITIERSQDCQDELKSIRELPTIERNGWTLSRNMRHVARIPCILVEKWMREDGISIFRREDWPAIRKKIADLDYMKLRVGSPNWKTRGRR